MKAIKAAGRRPVRMRALFKHVQKSGKVNGQYGMTTWMSSSPKPSRIEVPGGAERRPRTGWINAEERVAVVRQYRSRVLGIRTSVARTALTGR